MIHLYTKKQSFKWLEIKRTMEGQADGRKVHVPPTRPKTNM